MNTKVLMFVGGVSTGANLASFISLIAKFTPALQVPFLLLLFAFFLIGGIIAMFSPSTRPWLGLISVIVFIGGFAWLL